MTTTAYYMAPASLLVPRSRGRKIKVGGTVRVGGIPALCEYGLHASVHVLDAVRYRGVGCLTLVEIGGVIVEGGDKIAGQTRKTLAILTVKQTERVLREIACQCAEMVLQWGCYDRDEEPDQLSIDAIDTARRFARGECGRAELTAARDAAWGAVWAAVWGVAVGTVADMVWAAAGDAAAHTAAWNAEYAALDAVDAAMASTAALPTTDAVQIAMEDVADRMAMAALHESMDRGRR